MAYRWANRHRLWLAAGTGVLFFLTGLISHLATRQASGLELFWPCNAIMLGIMIARGRTWRDVAVIAGAGFAASIVLHLARADPLPLAMLFSVANVLESLLALILLRRLGRSGDIFDRVSDVLALVVACAGASLVSATLASAGLAISRGVVFLSLWRDWYIGAVLSQLVLAPMIVILMQLSDQRRMRTIAARTIAEVILVLGGVALATGAIFLYSRLPLLFLIAPLVLLATFRLRAFGAVAAVAIVAIVSGYATVLGQGPIVAMLSAPSDQVLLQQIFIASSFLTALPIAAMLTERDMRAEDSRMLADRFKSVVENIGEVIFRIDGAGRWAYLNPAWEALSGFAISQSLGRSWLECVDGVDRAQLADRVRPVLAGEAKAMRRVVRFNTAGGPRWMELFVQCLRDPDGMIMGATGTLRDIDDRKRLEEHVMTAKRRAEQRAREATLLASTDELTGIANRRAFMRQLDREIAGAAEFGWPLAVAMFDVDHFKLVNDRHGHAVGDRVLQQIAQRAGSAVRSGDLVGRLGGEEFGILMPGATTEDATIVAERLREAMEMAGAEHSDLPRVTVSVGIASREDQREAGALLAAADAALYAAKGAGRNRVRLAA